MGSDEIQAEIYRLESEEQGLNFAANDAFDYGVLDSCAKWECRLAATRSALRHLRILRDRRVHPVNDSEGDVRETVLLCRREVEGMLRALAEGREKIFDQDKWFLGQAAYVYRLKVDCYQVGLQHAAATDLLREIVTTVTYRDPDPPRLHRAIAELDSRSR